MLVSVNGVRLFIEVLGPKLTVAGPNMTERPTVIALHGGPSDHVHMRDMVGPLADVAQVILYDHRGCGRSDQGDPALWQLAQWGDDVKGLCDALDIEKPIVIGASFGGFVAQSYAIRHPGHAAKLVLMVTGARMRHDWSRAGFVKQGGEAAGEAYLAMARDPSPATFANFMARCRHLYTTKRIVDADLASRTRLNLALITEFFRTNSNGGFDFREGLAAVTGPVLILGGDEDPITPPVYQDELAACLTQARIQRKSFANAGHFLQMDASEAYFGTLRDFILS